MNEDVFGCFERGYRLLEEFPVGSGYRRSPIFALLDSIGPERLQTVISSPKIGFQRVASRVQHHFFMVTPEKNRVITFPLAGQQLENGPGIRAPIDIIPEEHQLV